MFKQMDQLGLHKPMLLTDVVIGNPDFITEFKADLEGALGAEFGVDQTNPKYMHLVDAYKTKYGSDVAYPSYAQTEYDAVYLLKDAISAVGYDGTKIAAFGHAVKDWPGASGSVTIDANGDRVGGHKAEIIKGGQVQQYSL